MTTSRPKVEEEDFNDYEYQSLDYDYYYDQLVPEHERFFQVHFGISCMFNYYL